MIYFIDITTPLNNTYSMYYDLLEPYINILKHFYNQIMNYIHNIIDYYKDFIKDYIIKDKTSPISNINIQEEIKSGVKSGIKEAIDEAIDDMKYNDKIEHDLFIKKIIIFSSTLLLFYIIFIIPSTTEDINQYNMLNQSLINIKTIIIDLFSKPSNPGNPGCFSGPNIGDITPPHSVTPSPIESPLFATHRSGK